MNDDEPLAYFITWTVYGTWFQGDDRGWRRDRLLHPVELLSLELRAIVASEIENHCQRRGWRVWIANPRTIHIHAVIAAAGVKGSIVRDQLKANCTRGLRQNDSQFVDRPVWSRGGDRKCVNSQADLETIV